MDQRDGRMITLVALRPAQDRLCLHAVWVVETSIGVEAIHRFHNRERCQCCGKVRIFHPRIIEDYVKMVLQDPERYIRPQGKMS